MAVSIPVRAVNRPGLPPMYALRKKFSQAMASVHDGIMYGNTKIVLMMDLNLISERATSQATVPPSPMAITQLPMETLTVFQNGL